MTLSAMNIFAGFNCHKKIARLAYPTIALSVDPCALGEVFIRLVDHVGAAIITRQETKLCH